MTVTDILRAASLPVTVHELRQASGMTSEEVYTELVSLEGRGVAKPIMRAIAGKAMVCDGWIMIGSPRESEGLAKRGEME